jgi:hypothetical protein
MGRKSGQFICYKTGQINKLATGSAGDARSPVREGMLPSL